MTHRRVRTVDLYESTDACSHIDPEFIEGLTDEQFDEAWTDYNDLHPWAEDFQICLLSPAGTGVEEWVPERLIGPFRERGYWQIIDDFQPFKLGAS